MKFRYFIVLYINQWKIFAAHCDIHNSGSFYLFDISLDLFDPYMGRYLFYVPSKGQINPKTNIK